MLERLLPAGGANMQISLEKIESILRREDIEGFLNLGAPQDEYSSEARKMGLALQAIDEPTEEEVSQVVMNVWDKAFGPFTDEDIEMRRPVLERIVRHILTE